MKNLSTKENMNNQNKDYGRLENLQQKINQLRLESVDPGFSQYLNTVQARLDAQVVQSMNLDNELTQNYKVYLQHFGVQVTPKATTAEMQIQEDAVIQVETSPQSEQVTRPIMQAEAVMQQESASQTVPTMAQPKPRRSVEFTIGTGLFCVIGVLFILSSFVMLGMTYMGGLFKGLSLYAIALLVILISELVFRKRMEKFSLALTGLGLAGLYTSTMVNSLYLHNFGNTVALIITVVVSVLAAVMARKKDSGIIKVISFVGCYAAFLPVGEFDTTAEFITASLILLFINVLTILLPVKRRAKAVHITHLISNMIITITLADLCLFGELVDVRWIIGFVISNLLVLSLVYYGSWKRGQCSIGVFVNFLVAFAAESLYYTSILMPVVHSEIYDTYVMTPMWYHIMFGVYGLFLVMLFLLFFKNRYKWIFYYFGVAAVFFTYGASFFDNDSAAKMIAVLIVFVVCKLLSRVKQLKVSEIVISAVTLFYALYAFDEGAVWAHVYAVVFLLSALSLKEYKVVHQYFITVSSILYLVVMYGEFELAPALVVGILFLLLFVFNNVKWWRAKKQSVYNIGVAVLLFAGALLTPVVAGPLNTLLVALFGTATVVLIFTDKYEMDFKLKYLLLELFWSYLVLQTEFEIGLITSLLLMIIAIAGVVMGFALSRKEVRVFGLVSSLLVCLKVLFYDFGSTPIQERMLLFLLVGVIILSISFIYILLEKKTANRGE